MLNESDSIELVDTDIDNDTEEKKIEIEDKIVVTNYIKLANNKLNSKLKFFIVNQKKRANINREITTPPPELT